MRAVLLGVLAVLLLTACAGHRHRGAPVSELTNICPSVRPQLCTLEYAPVCAVKLDGGRREYPSYCSACGDPAVKGWIGGHCAADVEQE